MFGVFLQDIFIVFLLMIGCRGWSFGKWVSISFRNFAPILVLILVEKGGLNHRMSFLLFRFLGGLLVTWGLKCNLKVQPDFCRASWQIGATLSNISLFEDKLESLLLMASGIFFIIDGGWLLWMWTYSGLSPGFRKGLYVSFSKLNSTSRNCTDFLFVWIVISRPNLLYVSLIFFFTVCSFCLADDLLIARPSSL